MRTTITIAFISLGLLGCEVGEALPPADPPEMYLGSVLPGTSSEAVAFGIESTGALQNRVYAEIGIVRVEATPEQADMIRELGLMRSLEPIDGIDGENAAMPARWRRDSDSSFAEGQNTSWGVAHVGGPLAATERALWVFDTGIELDNPDLDLNIDRERSVDMVVLFGGSDSKDTDHGTAVAGVAAALDNDRGTVGVTPGARVVSVRVLDDRGRGRMDTLIGGLNYAAELAAPGDVFNLSLAAPGRSIVIEDAVKRVANAGISVVLAAGNAASDSSEFTPAGLDHQGVYTVSASDRSNCLAEFSNHGEPIDFGAPGTNITVLQPFGGTTGADGTSFAAPHVAGLLLAGDLSSAGTVCGDQDGIAEPIAHR